MWHQVVNIIILLNNMLSANSNVNKTEGRHSVSLFIFSVDIVIVATHPVTPCVYLNIFQSMSMYLDPNIIHARITYILLYRFKRYKHEGIQSSYKPSLNKHYF